MLGKAIATALALACLTSAAAAGDLTGFHSVLAGKRIAYISADQGVAEKCGLDEKLIGNSIIAELKRGKVNVSNTWTDNSGIISMSITAVHLPSSRLCAISIRLQFSVVATEIQNKRTNSVVELWGQGGVLTYSDNKTRDYITQSVSDYTKQLADQIIADN